MYYTDRPKTAKTYAEKEWRAGEYRKLRTHLGLTQREVAKLTGLSYNTVRQIPSIDHDRIPSLYVLERMRAEIERRPYYAGKWQVFQTYRERIQQFHEENEATITTPAI